MKEQEFEKVVEWKKKPRVYLIIIGSITLFIGVLIVSFTSTPMFSDECMKQLTGIDLIFLIYGFLLTTYGGSIGGLILIVIGLGHGRKVYWRRVK